MDFYRLLKLNQRIKSHRVKFLGLWLLSLLDKRHLSIQLDPVLACNLRCKMCYFSDADFVRKNMKGILKPEEVDTLAAVFFPNALKLQIGCGAEPTLFKHNTRLIDKAKSYGVPYISMVTNGNLLTQKDVADFAAAGLDEIILSLHGVDKESYEDFMDKGSYEKFHEVLTYIHEEKQRHPGLRLRINYTFNEDNFRELSRFFELFGKYAIDIIQLRPIDRIGDTAYANFSLKEIEQEYAAMTARFREQAQERGINLLYPHSIERSEQDSLKVRTKNDSSFLVPYTYCYVSPQYGWKDGFDWRTDNLKSWRKRNGWNRKLLANAFRSRAALEEINRNMLNYAVDLNL